MYLYFCKEESYSAALYVTDGSGLELHLVVQLADVLLYVRQQASEGELLDELPDVVVVIQRQTGPVAPCCPHQALWIPASFLQLRLLGAERVQAARAARCVQLQRVTFQAGGGSVWGSTVQKQSRQRCL